MTNRQSVIHKRALQLKRQRGRVDSDIILNLLEAEETKLYLEFEVTSLFLYARDVLEYPKSVAYAFVNVARKASRFPDMKMALVAQKLQLTHAVRIASSLTRENAAQLVQFASTHTCEDINREVARINPKAAGKDRVKDLSDEYVEVTTTVQRPTYEKMKRAEDISGLSRAETLDSVYEEYLERNDKVRKAKRNDKEFCSSRVGELNAAETHAVNARDEGRCTWIDLQGHRCPNERWVETHHIIDRTKGGTNALLNLRTLCRGHHALLHARQGLFFGKFKIPPVRSSTKVQFHKGDIRATIFST